MLSVPSPLTHPYMTTRFSAIAVTDKINTIFQIRKFFYFPVSYTDLNVSVKIVVV